jgi:hypothetical protein
VTVTIDKENHPIKNRINIFVHFPAPLCLQDFAPSLASNRDLASKMRLFRQIVQIEAM